jgi:F0F1-type ATP synthase assembly protein I
MSDKPEPSKLALAFSVGTVLTSNIVGGIVIGYFLDRWLKTDPWLAVTGVILGTTSAFIGLYRIMNRLNRSD